MYILRKKTVLTLLFMSLFLSGCLMLSGNFPTYFDQKTYQNLTYLKPQILLLYETFGNTESKGKYGIGKSRFDLSEIRHIKLLFAQLYEYEKGKGPKNEATIRQIEILQEGFLDHVKHRMQKGLWNEFDIEDFSNTMSVLFDKAIQTEMSKTKQKK